MGNSDFGGCVGKTLVLMVQNYIPGSKYLTWQRPKKTNILSSNLNKLKLTESLHPPLKSCGDKDEGASTSSGLCHINLFSQAQKSDAFHILQLFFGVIFRGFLAAVWAYL